MKKLLVVLAIVALLVGLFAPIAWAGNGPGNDDDPCGHHACDVTPETEHRDNGSEHSDEHGNKEQNQDGPHGPNCPETTPEPPDEEPPTTTTPETPTTTPTPVPPTSTPVPPTTPETPTLEPTPEEAEGEAWPCGPSYMRYSRKRFN